MPPVFDLSSSSVLEDETPVLQENFKSRPTERKGPMNALSRKPIKGGGKSKGAPKRAAKKKGKKKKKKAVEEESSGGSLIVSDIKGVTIVDDPDNDSGEDNDSGDDGGISSEGGESDVSEYKDKSVVKRAARKGVRGRGVSSKTSSAKKATTVSGGLARKVSTRGSASAKSPKKGEGKRTSGRKGKATVGNTEGEDSDLPNEVEAGYYPDGENDENDLETSKTPAKRSSKKVTGGSVGRGTASRTARETTAVRRAPARTTAKAATKSLRSEKAPIGFESNSDQEEGDTNLLKEPQMPAVTKRKASRQEDGRVKKVAKRASTKSVGAIKAGLESLSLGRADSDADRKADEAGRSIQYVGEGGTGCIISGGTSEQRTAIISASSDNHGHSVLQSEPVRKGRYTYGGKSVAGLQALWEMGPPEHDSK